MIRSLRKVLFFSCVHLSVLLAVSPALADGRTASDWYDAFDHDARSAMDRGMGFLHKFREPGQCKQTVDELAGAMTSLSPEVMGAVVGLALGAAAGAASTASVLGALRGGILVGSVGSALGHLADVLLPDGVSALADNVQDMIQERDGRLCELIKASDKLRTPVLDHLQVSLARECQLDGRDASGMQACMRDNPGAAQIFERHVSVLSAINKGTCRVAASFVKRFERRTSSPSAPSCDDEPEAQPLGKNIL